MDDKDRSRKTITQMREDGGNGEEADSGHTPEAESTGSGNGLEVGCERKRSQDEHKSRGLAITGNRKGRGKTTFGDKPGIVFRPQSDVAIEGTGWRGEEVVGHTSTEAGKVRAGERNVRITESVRSQETG